MPKADALVSDHEYVWNLLQQGSPDCGDCVDPGPLANRRSLPLKSRDYGWQTVLPRGLVDHMRANDERNKLS